jgi:hypothetical protein
VLWKSASCPFQKNNSSKPIKFCWCESVWCPWERGYGKGKSVVSSSRRERREFPSSYPLPSFFLAYHSHLPTQTNFFVYVVYIGRSSRISVCGIWCCLRWILQDGDMYNNNKFFHLSRERERERERENRMIHEKVLSSYFCCASCPLTVQIPH